MQLYKLDYSHANILSVLRRQMNATTQMRMV
jgi:hypothetical protein